MSVRRKRVWIFLRIVECFQPVGRAGRAGDGDLIRWHFGMRDNLVALPKSIWMRQRKSLDGFARKLASRHEISPMTSCVALQRRVYLAAQNDDGHNEE
jgi:hypothetical protein